MFVIAEQFQGMVRQLGLDGPGVFSDPRIVPWRVLSDRENCTLDFSLPNGTVGRWHVKRYPPGSKVMEAEVAGQRMLVEAGIATVELVGFGRLEDDRSCVIVNDLSGFKPADKLAASCIPFEQFLKPTAELAAALHEKGLHHRDLYLCHFMARVEDKNIEVRLIDTARVGRLGSWLTRQRWVVKDLAQFWFSTTRLAVTDEQRNRWLQSYARQRGISAEKFLPAIERKVKAIARHDGRLNQKQPGRNVSLGE